MVDEGCIVSAPPTEKQLAVAAEINSVMCNHGFLYLDNVLPEQDIATAFEAAHELFSLPDQLKRDTLPLLTAQSKRGYSPYCYEKYGRRPPDLRENFVVRNQRWHHNNFLGTPSGFQETVLDFWERAEDVARRFQIACAIALNFPAEDHHFFAKGCERMDNCVMRLCHYPPCVFERGVSDGTTAEVGAVRLAEHTDHGMFTLLFLEAAAAGLQVKKAAIGGSKGAQDVSVDGWLNVPGRGRNSVLVNSGAALAHWTNDHWRATAHRVIVPDEVEASSHRYSIPFFVFPDLQTVVEPLSRFVSPGTQAAYSRITGADLLNEKMQAISTEDCQRTAYGGS
eukprot:TRINITY_DN65632_c0_g1_i1.p1 TRINITY_DN65632_c0_g1~~TRINITY_DN65632_c0_g1_i1.p1  ORF type:complete len:362 (-),score=35.07 TRINITY_DN65632_c0_g1_i1:228-1241(-)